MLSISHISPIIVGVANYIILLGIFLIAWFKIPRKARARNVLSEYARSGGLRSLIWSGFVEEIMIIVFTILLTGLTKSFYISFLVAGIGWSFMHITNFRSRRYREVYGSRAVRRSISNSIGALITVLIPALVVGLIYGIYPSFRIVAIALIAPHFFYHLTHNTWFGIYGYLLSRHRKLPHVEEKDSRVEIKVRYVRT